FELGLTALYVRPVGRVEFEGGVLLAASAVHLGGGLSAEAFSALSDTWSARLGLSTAALASVGDWGRVRTGVSAGALLRPVPYGQEGLATSLSGAFLGAELVLLVRP